MGDDSRGTRSLQIGFSAVVACFIASTVFSQLQAREIGALADSLSDNAMPSIRHLASARSEIRHLQAVARRYPSADEPTRTKVVTSLGEVRAAIDKDVRAYLQRPVYRGEDVLWGDIDRTLREVDRDVDDVRMRAVGHDVDGTIATIGALDDACDRAADALLADVEFNAKQGERIALNIHDLRTRSLMVAFVLDAVSVLLSVLVAVMAIRAVATRAKLLRAQSDLLAARADELDQFVGRVAHDIRGPIGNATLALTFVQRQPGLSEKVEAVVARGLSSLQRASRFVDGLLEFARAGARPHAGAKADVAPVIGTLVDDLRLTAEEVRVQLHLEPLPEVGVQCEPGILEVLVANLVSNAIKYIDHPEQRMVTVRAAERGVAVRVEIEDTGPGVPEELRRSIFEPFVRGPTGGRPGVGLGLATVQRICEAHGGQVGVTSRETGPGSVFWFELPRVS